MLLRRLMQHVREQDGFAVATDFVMLVAGILMAFQPTDGSAMGLAKFATFATARIA